MILPPKVIHPKGESKITSEKSKIRALIADTFNGIYRQKDTFCARLSHRKFILISQMLQLMQNIRRSGRDCRNPVAMEECKHYPHATWIRRYDNLAEASG